MWFVGLAVCACASEGHVYVVGELHGQGEGLAQAMRQVPLQYFTEEFDLTRCNACPHTLSPIAVHQQ